MMDVQVVVDQILTIPYQSSEATRGGETRMAQIGKREDAIKTRKVGGKAFPGDYNWECPVCHRECRAFEATCSYCEYDDRTYSEAN